MLRVFICFGLFAAVSCSGSEPAPKTNPQVLTSPTVRASNTAKLSVRSEAAAKQLMQLYDNKNCKEFIEAFPDSIQELDQLYGFDDVEGERILLSRSEEHISYFFECTEVSNRERLNKVIQVGVDGKWDADAIGMFQDRSLKLVRDNPDDAKKILDLMDDDSAASFWYFLFDGPHPSNLQGTYELFIDLLGKESKQSELLSKQYERLKADRKHVSGS